MGIQNQDGALFFASGIDNSGLRNDAKEASNIIKSFSTDAVKEGDKMKDSFTGVGTALGAIGGTAALGMLGKDILDTTAKFEKFGIVLRNTLGNDAGNDALDMIAQFAATTPFQLDEVTAAFIKMANQGFVPTREELVKLGDLASSTGKSFDQLAEALLDAQTGQFERLKEFGIKASANGDKVTFSFKEQQTTVDNTNSAIQKYILSLGELHGVAGANAKISESLTGQISNLEDKLAAMYNTIGKANKGALYDAVGGASSLIENYETIGKMLLTLVSTYSAYTAAVIALNAIKKTQLAMDAVQASLNTGTVASSIKLTAAQELQSISTIQLTTAQKLQAIAAEKGAVAQGILNNTMLTNPYVLAAMLLVGVGVALWAFHDSATAAERAQEALNKRIEEQKKLAEDERSELQNNINVIKDETSTRNEKQVALKTLQTLYPSIFSSLDIEKVKNLNLAEALKLVNIEIEKKNSLSDKNDLVKINSLLDSTKNGASLSEMSQERQIIGDKVSWYTPQETLRKELEAKKEAIIQNQKNLVENKKQAEFDDMSSKQKIAYLKKENIELATQQEYFKTIGILGTIPRQNLEKKINKNNDSIKKIENPDVKEVSESPEQEKKRLAAEKKAAAAAEKKKAAEEKLAQQIKDGKANAEKDLQSLLLDLQSETAKLLLKNSEDNLANRIAQINQEEKEEVQKITNRELAIIDAYNKAHKGDKSFKPLSTASGDVKSSISTIDSGLSEKLGVEELKITNAFGEKRKEATKKWGDEIQELAMQYADERVQIEHDYNEDIVKLVQSGELKAAGIATLERDKKISELTAAKIQETDLYKAATNDKIQASKETTEKLIADIKARIVAEQAAGKLSSETAKKMLADINSAQKTVAGDKIKNNPFAQLGNAISGNTEAGKALKVGQLDPKTSTADLAKLETEAASATASMAGAAGAALQGVQSILGSVVGGLSDLGMLTDEQKKTADEVMGMVGGAANLAMGIASGNPMQIIQGSVDLLVNGFKLFDSKTKAAEKEIKKQQGLIDSLKKSYDDLEDSITKAFSTTKAQLVTSEMENLKAQNEAITKQIAAEKSKKKVDSGAITNYEDAIDANKKKIEELKDSYIEALTGTDVMSAIDSLANAYADVWTSGEDQAKKSFEVVRGWIKTALIDQLKNKLQPEVTGIMNSIASAMEDGTISQSEQAAIDVLTNALDAKAAQYKNALDPYLEDSKKSGVTGQLSAATTEATSSQLVGLWTMTSLDIRSIKEWLLYGNKVDQAKTVDISASVGVIMENTRKIELNTKRSADNTDGLSDSIKELKDELTEIKKNTKPNNSRG